MGTQGTPFRTPPRALDYSSFMDQFGGVYEHSPWIARAVWQQGLDERHDTVEGLGGVMANVLAQALDSDKLALLRAHPELAAKAAVGRALTADSTDEQAGAGLDQCSEHEYERFMSLNARYNERFGFPFIMAVKGCHRTEILAEFERRVNNDRETEFATALDQVNRIARLRLEVIAGVR
ncbi:MAG: 2-oxo-4-hydroxy-4-carboxy-5-ureidoimidazoline decarboxylase [Ectothiorhodospiraceae bacterium]